MVYAIDKIVPWGRSFDEYIRMFALNNTDLKRRIIACADGPAGFNAQLTRLHGHVVSVDPLYRYEAHEIQKRINDSYDMVIQQVEQNKGNFVWNHIRSVTQLAVVRMQAMRTFLDDFPQGKQQGRYIDAQLPSVPFPSRSFDLALCSHFLFLYSAHLSLQFHIDSIIELCRIAQEVRIFPLIALDGTRSAHLGQVIRSCAEYGYQTTIERVDYEFQKHADEMLRIIVPS